MTLHNFFSSGHLRAAVVAAVAAMALALSGCNTGAGPDAADTASPAVSQTPSATPAPTPTATAAYVPASASGRAQNVPVPVLPEVAKTETKEGAIAFARYWFQVLSYSYETGELSLLDRLTPQTCGPCQKSAEAIRAWHSDGRWLVGGQISTPAVETAFSKDVAGQYKVSAQVHQVPLSYFRADGTVAHTDPQAADQGNLLIISYSSDSWRLDEVGSIVG
jgi:predicted small secreted protein